jgi:hypothetical protein
MTDITLWPFNGKLNLLQMVGKGANRFVGRVAFGMRERAKIRPSALP